MAKGGTFLFTPPSVMRKCVHGSAECGGVSYHHLTYRRTCTYVGWNSLGTATLSLRDTVSNSRGMLPKCLVEAWSSSLEGHSFARSLY